MRALLDAAVQVAMPVQHQGTFVTLDRSIAPASVPGARKEHLTVLGVAP